MSRLHSIFAPEPLWKRKPALYAETHARLRAEVKADQRAKSRRNRSPHQWTKFASHELFLMLGEVP